MTEEFDKRCVQADWSTYIVGPPLPKIEVGATGTAALQAFGFQSLTDDCVAQFLATVSWSATVSGIVSIRPGDRVDRAFVTGVAVGETRLEAQLTFVDGSTKGTSVNERVQVVPATPH